MSVVYKCKECGGAIEPQENGLGKCLYCGAVQTLPKEQDDKISNLLNRANDFRLNCDFDRAIFEYEKVIELSESEPEAHWGIFLSKYGVEYVKDNMTFTYKPTLHRISSVSVFDDLEYQTAMKYASPYAAIQYKKDAEDIEVVMKELLLLSANQDPYDVFLSYKELDDTTRQRTDDSYLAHDLYNELTAQGYKVFFAPKSLGVGLYEPKIYSAIISSKVMIVLGTQQKYFDAVWVKNEWTRFAELIENREQKVLVPVFKNMEASQLPNRLVKYQALDMSNISFLQTLTGIIAQSVNRQSRVNFNRDASAEDAYLERGFLALEDRDFSQANSFFENVLNLNPHNAQAYFGKLMVEMRVNKQEQILTSSRPLSRYKNFSKALRFADQQLKTTLIQYEQKVQNVLNEQTYNNIYKEMKSVIGSTENSTDYIKEDIEANNQIISNLNSIISKYETLGDFGEAKKSISICKKAINLLNEKNQIIENQNKEEEKKAKEKALKLAIVKFVLMIVGAFIGVVLFVSMIHSISASIEISNQAKATEARQTALSYLDEAEILLNDNDRDGAIEKAKLAIEECNDIDIKEKYDYYLSFEPWNLCSKNSVAKIDYDGNKLSFNSYDKTIKLLRYPENDGCICTLTYQLDSKYDIVSGTIVSGYGASDYAKNFHKKEQIVIYGDGKKLYQSSGFDKEFEAYEFEIDVNNVQTLTVEFVVDSYNYPNDGPINTSFGIEDFAALKNK